MTHIYQAATNETERAKWRQQANAAAKHMKNVKDWGALTVFVPAFVFDDGMVKLTLEVAVIQRLPRAGDRRPDLRRRPRKGCNRSPGRW
jgi:hypothetical protein